MEKLNQKKKAIDVSTKSFLSAVIVLLAFMIVATVLTFVLPKGNFAIGKDGSVDYSTYIPSASTDGINVFRAIISPILVFVTGDFLQPVMLCIFFIIISGVFQSMLDCGGMQAIVSRLVKKFKNKRFLFLAILTLFFMCLGSFFGLFEETLILLPMVVAVCVSLGYDQSMGFLVCSLATGIGFSVAITNPFTVVYSSDLIGASLTSGLWFRLICFALFYGLVLGFIWLNAKRITKNQTAKPIEEVDELALPQSKKTFIVWLCFLILALFTIILSTALPFLRDFSTPVVAVVFLIGGLVASWLTFGFKRFIKSFGKGALAVLPALLMIAMAFAIKLILVEGNILDTITNYIVTAIHGHSKYLVVLILFAIILVLEFFISSSVAKAVFVMGVLKGVIASGLVQISPEMLVLIYIFSDGFTNMLFPTSPCLLIGLSMTGQSYLGWLKKSKFLFPIIFALSVGLLMLALAVGY